MYNPSLAIYLDWLTVLGFIAATLLITWQILVRSKRD